MKGKQPMINRIQKILDKLSSKKPIHQRYPQYDIGKRTYGDPKVLSWNEGATLKIGSFCSISKEVTILLGGEHHMDWVTTFPLPAAWKHGHPHTKGDVVIGNDVWIGNGAFITSGVTIGSGAVIGARAVVTKDVPPYGIVAGNPAQLIRTRFAQETIDRLLKIAWWTWPDEKIERFQPLLLDSDIERFLSEAEKDISDHH